MRDLAFFQRQRLRFPRQRIVCDMVSGAAIMGAESAVTQES